MELSYPYPAFNKPESLCSMGARLVQSSQHPITELAAHNQEWARLIARVAEGDHDALAKFYDLSNRFTCGLLIRILGNAATAEEVLLDVYLQVWRQASRYNAQRGNPRAWLVTMARSRAIDRLRADKQTLQREEALTGIESAGIPDDVASQVELRGLVCTALEALGPEQREVIELAFYSGMSHSEMAAHLHEPLGTVKTRVRRAMIKLRELIESGPGGGV